MPELPEAAVYTALVGGYEELTEQPVAKTSRLPFICFTDDPDLVSDTWDIRVVDLRFPMDIVRSARALKVRGHASLDRYAQTLWIDNTVRLKALPETLLDEWLRDTDIAIPHHSYRRKVVSEFDAVAVGGYDDSDRIYEQLLHYSEIRPDILDEHPFWTGILARRSGPSVRGAMEMWFDQILRYSRRDQLSANFVMAESAVSVSAVDIDNFDSTWHQWPVAARRKTRTVGNYRHALRPPVAELGRLRNDLDELVRQTDASIRARETEIERLEAKVLDLQRQIGDFRATRSWRWTRGLRAVRGLASRMRH